MRTDADAIATCPLGEAQAGLVRAWHALVDAPLDAVADCPACGAALELTVPVEQLSVAEPRTPHPVTDDEGTALTPRLPTAADLDAVSGMDADAARRDLVRLTTGVEDPSPRLQAAVAAALEDADPAASWWVGMTCPACTHAWEEPLDLAGFVWHEVEHAARGLIADVAALAAAYGWSESTVLALTPARRAAYLDLAVG